MIKYSICKSKVMVMTGLLLFNIFFTVATTAAQSLLWKITRQDIPYASYLYGTIHLTDARIFEWKDSVYKRVRECTAFASEIDMSMGNMIKAASLLFLPENQTLSDRFSREEYEIIRQAVKLCSGYDLAMFNKLKPPSLIALCFANKQEGDLESTVDEMLYKYATSSGIAAYGIETVEEQIALFDKIPDSYVLEYFRNIDEQDVQLEKLIHYYRSANLDSLLTLIEEEESGSLLNKEIITLRNHLMTERIIPHVAKQSTFIAIGCGHLPGDDGVIKLLRRNGYTVVPDLIW